MKRSWIFSAILLAAAGASAYLMSGGPSGGKKTGTPSRSDLVQRVTIAGNITSRRRTLVTAPYNGYVREIFVKVGDKVKPGQPLVSVAQSLQTSEPVFPLRAPYAGTVMHLLKKEGEYVKEADTAEYILRLDDLSEFFVQANAPEVDWAKLRLGMEAVIKASAVPNKSYRGKITELTLAPQLSQSSRGAEGSGGEYPVQIALTDPDQRVGPGMSTVVDIITARKEKVLTLPLEFVLKGTDGFYVMPVSGGKRKIETGMQNDELVELLSGLREGEAVRQVDFTELGEGSQP